MMRSPAAPLYYQVIPPHPLLAPYIGCYWILAIPVGQPTRQELILPDGYAELILNYGSAYTWYDQARQIQQTIQTVHLVGERDASILVELGGGISQIGVKFKPAGLFALLGQPLNAIANQIAQPDELSQSSIQILYEELFEIPMNQAKINYLNTFFLKQLLETERVNLLVEQALQLILHHQGNLRIEELKTSLNIHYKTLERQFKTYVGLSPKTFARIVRFKHTYKHFHQFARHDPSFFLDLGYYDQNHFIKDFKYFLHTTPSAYCRKQRSLSDEIVRRGLVERSQVALVTGLA